MPDASRDYDRLADVVRESLDMVAVRRIAGLEAPFPEGGAEGAASPLVIPRAAQGDKRGCLVLHWIGNDEESRGAKPSLVGALGVSPRLNSPPSC